MAARRYKDSNQVHSLLSSFAASIKDEAGNIEAEYCSIFNKFTHYRSSFAKKNKRRLYVIDRSLADQ